MRMPFLVSVMLLGLHDHRWILPFLSAAIRRGEHLHSLSSIAVLASVLDAPVSHETIATAAAALAALSVDVDCKLPIAVHAGSALAALVAASVDIRVRVLCVYVGIHCLPMYADGRYLHLLPAVFTVQQYCWGGGIINNTC